MSLAIKLCSEGYGSTADLEMAWLKDSFRRHDSMRTATTHAGYTDNIAMTSFPSLPCPLLKGAFPQAKQLQPANRRKGGNQNPLVEAPT
jgi:hypothetical protein